MPRGTDKMVDTMLKVTFNIKLQNNKYL